MALRPWYKVITPREDLREGKPLDAAEFAVHLDQVRDGRAPQDYQVPARFFDRTYLTTGLTNMAAEVLRRLSGQRTETSAVFNLATQFGGGKTHALTLLYHLTKHGPAADGWTGVSKILHQAGLASVPQARVAVFVGTEFDAIAGRGGADGTPHRQTPWGEIAFQLGGESAFQVVADHDAQFIEPKGDVIRRFLPSDQPCLILLDEIINYVSTYRRMGYHNSFYNFLQALSETVRGQDNAVLLVSIPASELEYTSEDETDERRFKKMLDRLGKAVMMAADKETSQIIRRRLFEGSGLSPDAQRVVSDYADWVIDHRRQLPGWFPVDHAREALESAYPFHPTVLSVFERKWQALPRFQRTRGILRLLALWVSHAYQEGYQGAHRDPLITLGTAPLDDPFFRAAVFEQLGEHRLEAAVTTDICGKRDAHAVRLDTEAVDTIREARLHRKVATVVFFESNGGQARAEATLPEVRLAVADPGLDIGNVETALENLRRSAYYLSVEGNRYRFSFQPNLNSVLADRKATIKDHQIDGRVRAEIQKVFSAGKGVERIYFPDQSNQIPNRAVLTLVVLAPEQSMQDAQTMEWIETMTKEAGTSSRIYKSALLWAVAEDDGDLREAARELLAWESIRDEQEALGLDDLQQQELTDNLLQARRELTEAVWRSYRYLILLGKENTLRVVNLGLVHSRTADSLVGFILRRLRQDGDLEDAISPHYLVRHWPALEAWSTEGVRDAFFASPAFPRLSNPAAIRETIAKGVRDGVLAYVGLTPEGDYEPFFFRQPLYPVDVEISEEMFMLQGEVAEAYVEAQAEDEVIEPVEDERAGEVAVEDVTPEVETEDEAPGRVPEPKTFRRLTWRGEVDPRKWSNFYMKVLSRFVTGGGLTLRVEFEVEPEGGVSEHRVEETRTSLRELGLEDEVKAEM